MKHYIVSYERKPQPEYKEFHEAFVAHNGFITWWHYIQSCYLISTELSANKISDHFNACAKAAGIPTTHLVLRVDLRDRQGMLVKDAWEWISNQTKLS